MTENEKKELKLQMSTEAEESHQTDPNVLIPTSDPKEDTHSAMSAARSDFEATLERETTALAQQYSREFNDEELAQASTLDLETYTARRNKTLETLQSPVPNVWKHDDETFRFEDTTGKVGNWDWQTVQQYHQRVASTDENNPAREYWQSKLDEKLQKYDYLKASQERDITPDNSKIHIKKYNTDKDDVDLSEDLLQSPNTSVVLTGSTENELCDAHNNLASFFAEELTIQVKTFSDEERSSQTGTNTSSLFAQGDPFVQLEVINHENVHRDHFINDGTGALRITPINAAKADRLTETTAEAATWLQYAYQYTELKKQKVTTIEVNGEQKPIEYILEIKPGLKEALAGLDTDFDITKAEHKKAIVKAASEYWHSERKEFYNRQAYGATLPAQDIFAMQSWDTQLSALQKEEQTYADVSQRMLKDVPILLGSVRVDLTDCKDLLDTMSTNEATQLLADRPHITLEEMQEIDAHLQSKGCKTEVEKMEYMKNFLANTYLRTGECQDPELLNILLSHNPQITYADMLTVTQHGPVSEVNGLKVNTSQLPTATEHHEPPVEEKTNSPISPVLAMAMQKQGR